MTQQDLSRSFPVSTAMSRGRVVQLFSDGNIRLNPINSLGIGVLAEDCAGNSYENPKVRLWGAGTVGVSVTGTGLTAGDTLYAVTSGQVAGTNGATTMVGAAYGRVLGVLAETTGSGQNGNLFEMIMQTNIGPITIV